MWPLIEGGDVENITREYDGISCCCLECGLDAVHVYAFDDCTTGFNEMLILFVSILN